MTKWEIVYCRVGEQQKYLDEGWEPFAVSAQDTSYKYNNGRDTAYRTTDCIYLKRKVKE